MYFSHRQGVFVLHFLILAASGGLYAQQELQFPLETIYAEVDDNRIRKILSKVTFSFSGGSARYNLDHEINGVGIYQSDSLGPLLVSSNSPRPVSGTTGWSAVPATIPIKNQTASGEFITASDTSFFYKAQSSGIPFNLEATYHFRSYYIGLGGGIEFIANTSFEQQYPKNLANQPPLFNNLLRPVPLSRGNVSLKKFYVYLGFEFSQWRRFFLRGDLKSGLLYMGRNFDKDNIRPGFLINAGFSLRREFSENLSVFVRPYGEYSSYTLTPPGLNTDILHRIGSMGYQIGVHYTIPALPRCYITACRAQIDHAHGNRQYRSRVHPFTKKQNPGYGENKVRVKPNRVKTIKAGAKPR